MPHWTISDMSSTAGQTAIVTGANSGLGFQAAKQLAAHGSHVILACRDTGRGKAALETLHGKVPDASAEVRTLDLASLESIKEFAESVTEPVHLLINNAGVMALPKRTTADGFEMQFGTNHLGHFALTGRLLPQLIAKPGARVVTVSSDVHRIGRINFDDLQGEKRYSKWMAYGQSKLANILFANELGKRAAAAGIDLTSTSAHPGYAATNLQTAGAKMSGNRVSETVMKTMTSVFGQSDAQGALPTLYAATSDEVTSGQYVGPSGPLGMRGTGAHPVTRSKRAVDEAAAKRLWEVSEQLTGVTYGPLDES